MDIAIRDSEASNLSILQLYISDNYVQQYFQVATLTLVLYDAREYFIDQILINTIVTSRQVITFEKEVRHLICP